MATATASEGEIRNVLPKEVEDQPSSTEVNDYLTIAAEEVDRYDLDGDSTKIKRAEQYYAAWLLVDVKYQIPVSSDEAGVSEEHAVDPASKLKDKFKDIVGGSLIRVL